LHSCLSYSPATLFGHNTVEEIGSRFLLGNLRHEATDDGELEDSLFETVDAVLGGEQGVEMGGHSGPIDGQLVGVLRAGERVQQGIHERFVGAYLVAGLLLQAVAEGHEFIDSLDDSRLLPQRR